MKRVLVIEDNEDNMELITFILEKSGFTTIRAENGKKGIELALKERPDFILLDIQLPDMDGMEVLRRIRNLEFGLRNEKESKIQNSQSKIKPIPVIAVTSYAMSGDRERLLENGCNGYIEKPINPETFIVEIKKHL